MIVGPIVIAGLPGPVTLIGHGSLSRMGSSNIRHAGSPIRARGYAHRPSIPRTVGGERPNENSIPGDVNNNGFRNVFKDGIMEQDRYQESNAAAYPQRICTVT
jgi:hypothetical protein